MGASERYKPSTEVMEEKTAADLERPAC
jgi:hypothetical protein